MASAHLLERKPGQLSGGQQQRVALGRAIVAEAPVCLMDEPLSNLDAQLRADMRREILALQRRLGITMLYVTHDQTEAMGMADQIVLLRDGHIEQDAPPAEIYARPATSFAASFIGTPPMNLFPLERRGRRHGVAGHRRAGPGATCGPARCWAASVPRACGWPSTVSPHAVRHAEYLGADTVLACTVGEVSLLARLPGRVVLADGTPVRLATDEPIHLFDAATGRRDRKRCRGKGAGRRMIETTRRGLLRAAAAGAGAAGDRPRSRDRDRNQLLLSGRRRRTDHPDHRRLCRGLSA